MEKHRGVELFGVGNDHILTKFFQNWFCATIYAWDNIFCTLKWMKIDEIRENACIYDWIDHFGWLFGTKMYQFSCRNVNLIAENKPKRSFCWPNLLTVIQSQCHVMNVWQRGGTGGLPPLFFEIKWMLCARVESSVHNLHPKRPFCLPSESKCKFQNICDGWVGVAPRTTSAQYLFYCRHKIIYVDIVKYWIVWSIFFYHRIILSSQYRDIHISFCKKF